MRDPVRRTSPCVAAGPFLGRRSVFLLCAASAFLVPAAHGDSTLQACRRPAELATRLQSHPDPQTWLDLGAWFADHGQLPCAQQAFRSGLRLAPQSAQLNFRLALSLYQAGDLQAALAPVKRSIQADAGVPEPHLLLATLYSRLGHAADAEPEWRTALQLDPHSDVALHGLSQALLAQQKYQAEIALLRSATLDAALAMDLAAAYDAVGMSEDAVSTMKAALADNPNSVELSAALVSLYIRSNHFDQAQHQAEDCYRTHPDDVEAQISYLKTLVLNGQWPVATDVGQKLLAAAPRRYETLYLNGIIEREKGDYAAARIHLTEAESLNPAVANLHYNLGVVLARVHDLDGAIAELRKAIAEGDTQAETHFELANALRLQGKTDDARQEMLLSEKRRDEENRASVATAKTVEADQDVEKGDLPHAIALYREALDATPDNAMIAWKLSLALDKANDLEGEHQALEQVIQIDPGFALAQNQLGYLDSRSGNWPAAEQHFRQAVHAAPALTPAWISLAATLGVESRFPEAQEALATALRLDPDNRQAKDLNDELQRMQYKQRAVGHSPRRPR